ncbi:MAG: hypothetical protein FJ000_01320 [Actinobacteria bacterium]|nr:hypothetical protein [Actinomycetota bacterium]
MALLGPNAAEVQALQEQGDVQGMLRIYGGTKRRDTRGATITALRAMGEPARQTLLETLADEELQRTAAATLVEISAASFDDVTALLESGDPVRRAGALYTAYYYARYRDMPAALALLQTTAAGAEHDDVAAAARAMVEKVEQVDEERTRHIDELLAKISLLLQEESLQPKTTAAKMFSAKRRDRVDAMNSLVAMRYPALHRVLERAGEFGDTAVAALVGLALNEIGSEVIPPIQEALPTADKPAKGVLMKALLCLRQARVDGAAEAVDASGIRITESLDRGAAKVYFTWIKG